MVIDRVFDFFDALDPTKDRRDVKIINNEVLTPAGDSNPEDETSRVDNEDNANQACPVSGAEGMYGVQKWKLSDLDQGKTARRKRRDEPPSAAYLLRGEVREFAFQVRDETCHGR